MSCIAWRGPIFNDVYNESRDPRSFLHAKLGPVPGFSGGSEYSVTLVIPFNWPVFLFGIFSRSELMQWTSYFGILFYELAIIVSETSETVHISHCLWHWPFLNGFNFSLICCNPI